MKKEKASLLTLYYTFLLIFGLFSSLTYAASFSHTFPDGEVIELVQTGYWSNSEFVPWKQRHPENMNFLYLSRIHNGTKVGSCGVDCVEVKVTNADRVICFGDTTKLVVRFEKGKIYTNLTSKSLLILIYAAMIDRDGAWNLNQIGYKETMRFLAYLAAGNLQTPFTFKNS